MADTTLQTSVMSAPAISVTEASSPNVNDAEITSGRSSLNAQISTLAPDNDFAKTFLSSPLDQRPMTTTTYSDKSSVTPTPNINLSAPQQGTGNGLGTPPPNTVLPAPPEGTGNGLHGSAGPGNGSAGLGSASNSITGQTVGTIVGSGVATCLLGLWAILVIRKMWSKRQRQLKLLREGNGTTNNEKQNYSGIQTRPV